MKVDPQQPFKPTKEISEIIKLSEDIQAKRQDFFDKYYTPSLNKLLQLVKQYNYDHNEEYKAKIDANMPKKPESKIKKILKKFGFFKKK